MGFLVPVALLIWMFLVPFDYVVLHFTHLMIRKGRRPVNPVIIFVSEITLLNFLWGWRKTGSLHGFLLLSLLLRCGSRLLGLAAKVLVRLHGFYKEGSKDGLTYCFVSLPSKSYL